MGGEWCYPLIDRKSSSHTSNLNLCIRLPILCRAMETSARPQWRGQSWPLGRQIPFLLLLFTFALVRGFSFSLPRGASGRCRGHITSQVTAAERLKKNEPVLRQIASRLEQVRASTLSQDWTGSLGRS